MEIRALAELTEQVIDRVAAKLEVRPTAARDDTSVRGADRTGEWQIALEHLVAVLVNERIPVTVDEHRDLRALFESRTASRGAEVRRRANTALSDLAKVAVSC